MSPEIEGAIPGFVERGWLDEGTAARLLAVARGDRLSILPELRVLLSAAVVLVATGVGLLVAEHHARLGPVTIATAIALAALALLVTVWRRPPEETFVREGLLLLAVLLMGADLAYTEVQFAGLGRDWPWHFLVVSVVAAALSLRFDAVSVFALALTSFAAWRGVGVATLRDPFWAGETAAMWNAVGCGLLFVAIGAALRVYRVKPHFEPTAVHLGALLAIGALVHLVLQDELRPWTALFLLALSAVAILSGWAARRFWILAMGVGGMYLGVTRLLFEVLRGERVRVWWLVVSSLAVLVALYGLHRRTQDEPA